MDIIAKVVNQQPSQLISTQSIIDRNIGNTSTTAITTAGGGIGTGSNSAGGNSTGGSISAHLGSMSRSSLGGSNSNNNISNMGLNPNLIIRQQRIGNYDNAFS